MIFLHRENFPCNILEKEGVQTRQDDVNDDDDDDDNDDNIDDVLDDADAAFQTEAIAIVLLHSCSKVGEKVSAGNEKNLNFSWMQNSDIGGTASGSSEEEKNRNSKANIHFPSIRPRPVMS